MAPAYLAGRNSPDCCPRPRRQPTFRSFKGRARKHRPRSPWRLAIASGPSGSRARERRLAERLDEARSAEEQAKARLTAAEASLAQYNAARTGGATDAEGLFIVRAPVSGVIAQRNAATGANVTAGSVLFRVVDAAQVHVVGQVPEAQAARARLAQAAEIEIAGTSRIACRPAAS